MNLSKKIMTVLATGAILMISTTQIFADVLTSEQAKNIALRYVPEGSIHINTKEEYNQFEIKLYNQKDQTAYEIDIDKTTQKPISFDSKSQCHIGGIQVILSEEQAKNIILQEIPQAQFVASYLDWDDGMQEYKISFYTANIQGEYQINAQNGMIVEREIKFIENPTVVISQKPTTENTVTQNTIKPTQTMLTVEQAKQIAQSKAPNAILYEIKLDNDDGKMIYEGEMKEGYIEYEFEIDAVTGVIIEWDVDIDD